MTFTEIKGNIFDRKLEKNEFYVHCISRDYVCSESIAKEFNKRYDLTRRLNERTPFKVMVVDNVINLVTKSKCHLKTTYKSLNECLFLLYTKCDENVKTLVMPRLGCGLDGLEWDNIKRLIKDIFEDTDIAIEIYYL